ncbi:hypothetical protein ZHAS_00014752 [Anopheles sinensis]|uniref:Uncharacterized protein n=1 Tax=Anopheles sinensis TaxID=74873 RepID=A0A084W957_ANOSI|nr:hypothetical protein ZHAS_00014752 [Anopheles sinensis]
MIDAASLIKFAGERITLPPLITDKISLISVRLVRGYRISRENQSSELSVPTLP